MTNKVLCCKDCGLPYSEFGLDTTVSNHQWRVIVPESEDAEMGIVLCANCMVKRASELPGMIAARMVFEFSPSQAAIAISKAGVKAFLAAYEKAAGSLR